MISYTLFLGLLLAPCIIGRPQAAEGPTTTPIPIISHSESVGENGTFNFSFETGNGIHSEQSGYVKDPIVLANRVGGADGEEPQPIQVISGSYSYQAPDGTQISLKYIADENGFQPEGDHLPTPPPIPEEIQRVLASLPQQAEQTADAAPIADAAAAASIPNIEILKP